MRYLIVGLVLIGGCVGCTEQSNTEFTEAVLSSLASLSGSGGVWLPQGPVLVDRRTGRTSMFEVRASNEFTLTATFVPDKGAFESYGATGISAGDIDADDAPEFFVAAENGASRLLKKSEGRLVDITTMAGLPTNFKSTFASAFIDIDRDGDADLYVAQSASFATIHRACEAAKVRSCLATEVVGSFPNRLFLNDGHGHFAEAPDAFGANHPGATLAFTFADLDLDGDPDLYLANDFGPDVLYRNDGGRFTEITRKAGVSILGGGMGVAAGDIDGNGLPDLYVTHYGKDTVWLNQGGMRFVDASASLGVMKYSAGTVGWGVVLEDLNGDSRLDVAVARGWWDPDAVLPPGQEQPAYTIAYNQDGKNFQAVKEGSKGIGAWGLISNRHGSILVLSPFKSGRPLLLQRR